MVAALRANSSVPYCIIPPVVEHCNQIVDTAINALSHATIDSLKASGLDAGLLRDIEKSLSTQAYLLKQPLNFISTRYKQDKNFDTHHLAVKPESIVLGHRIDAHSGHSAVVYDTFE